VEGRGTLCIVDIYESLIVSFEDCVSVCFARYREAKDLGRPSDHDFVDADKIDSYSQNPYLVPNFRR
jgi:hypothetical protein